MIDKINILYKTSQELGSSYSSDYGFVHGAMKIGAVRSALNVMLSKPQIDMKEVIPEYLIKGNEPIVCINGYREYFDWIYFELGRNRHYILIETESTTFKDRDGDPNWNFGKNWFFDRMASHAQLWKTIYTHTEADTPSYFGRPSRHIFGYINTDVFTDMDESYPPLDDRILMIGSLTTGERIELSRNFSKVHYIKTESTGDPLLNSICLARAINSHLFYLDPLSNTKNCTSRVFQGLACKRLVLIQRNPYVTKFPQVCKDFVHCRYWSTPNELYSIHEYYLNHKDEAMNIAANGQRLCRELFTVECLVKRIIDEYNAEYPDTLGNVL